MFGQTREYTADTVDNNVVFFLEMMTRQVDILRKEYPNRVFEEIKTFHFNIRIVRAHIAK